MRRLDDRVQPGHAEQTRMLPRAARPGDDLRVQFRVVIGGQIGEQQRFDHLTAFDRLPGRVARISIHSRNARHSASRLLGLLLRLVRAASQVGDEADRWRDTADNRDFTQ